MTFWFGWTLIWLGSIAVVGMVWLLTAWLGWWSLGIMFWLVWVVGGIFLSLRRKNAR